MRSGTLATTGGGTRVRPFLIVVLAGLGALGLVPAGLARGATQATVWAELKQDLPEDPADRRAALLAFVEDERPSLKDRLAAATQLTKQLGKDKSADARERVAALAWTARLYGVSGKAKKRKGLWGKAIKIATKEKDKKLVATLTLAKDGDAALARLEKQAKKARKAKKAASRKASASKSAPAKARTEDKKAATVDDAKAVRKAIPAWLELHDEPTAALAELVLLELDEARRVPPRKLVDKSKRLVDGELSHRDLAPARAGLHELRSGAFLRLEQWEDAARESLAADHAAAAHPKKALTAPDPHSRSWRSAELCRAAREHGVSCDRVEEEQLGGKRTFYDFSKKSTGRFSYEKAAEVLSEYEGLLKNCIQVSDQLGDLDTEVEFEWKVAGTGRVEDFTIRPRFLEGRGEFRSCAEKAFAQFRYPRFKGPVASVAYSLSINNKDLGEKR